MFGSEQVHTINFDLGTDPGGDKDYPIWRAPRPCTVQRLVAFTNKAHNAGTAYKLWLENWDTGGTAIKSSGGVMSGTIGGTADPFGADTPDTTTTLANPYMAQGEYLALALDEEGAGWQSGERLRVQIDVVFGKAASNA